jgi:hypothetical protein
MRPIVFTVGSCFVAVLLIACERPPEADAGGAAGDTVPAVQPVSPAEIERRAEPMTPEEAERRGVVDTTIQVTEEP